MARVGETSEVQRLLTPPTSISIALCMRAGQGLSARNADASSPLSGKAQVVDTTVHPADHHNALTIAAAFLTDEGVVFGADSATTVTVGNGTVAQLFNNAQKVFQIGQGNEARIALCTFGNAALGNISHRRAVALLGDSVTPTMSIDEVADKLVAIATTAGATEEGARPVGYFLGGVDLPTRAPKCFRMTFGGGPSTRSELGVGDCLFEGMPDFFTRVFHGYDPKLPMTLFEALLPKLMGILPPGVDVNQIAFDAVNEAIAKIPSGIAAHLPLRDAIDFVHTYLHMTIKAFKFRVGPPVCGGPIEIGFISADRPFRWVCHKPFDSAIFQAEGVL